MATGVATAIGTTAPIRCEAMGCSSTTAAAWLESDVQVSRRDAVVAFMPV
jgi:hypothetical protein